jgi:hypothetical protein
MTFRQGREAHAASAADPAGQGPDGPSAARPGVARGLLAESWPAVVVLAVGAAVLPAYLEHLGIDGVSYLSIARY